MSVPVIIDTDGGVDDAAALWWALTNPALDVLAITVVWGNVPIDVAARSVARVIEATGRTEVPIAIGAAARVADGPEMREATFIHGEDGLGNTTAGLPAPNVAPTGEPAASLLHRVCAARPGEITVVTLGPLSTLGALITDDHSFAGNVGALVVMGGSARVGGNALPNGEANVAHDPRAAAIVAGADWREPPLLVGLDVTWQATLTDAHFRLLAEHRSPAAAFLDAPLRTYRKFGATFTRPNCPCHDLLAVMAAGDPEVITDAPVLPMAVDDGGGPAWGATVVDLRAPAFASQEGSVQETPRGFSPWRISLGADVERFRARATVLFGG